MSTEDRESLPPWDRKYTSPRVPVPQSRLSGEDALKLLQHSISSYSYGPGLSADFHRLFPAPRGSLQRHELCTALVRLLNMDRMVVALALSLMDPTRSGLDFTIFDYYIRAGQTDEGPSLEARSEEASELKGEIPSPAISTLQWRVPGPADWAPTASYRGPKVYDNEVAEHGLMHTTSHLGEGSLIPTDERHEWGYGEEHAGKYTASQLSSNMVRPTPSSAHLLCSAVHIAGVQPTVSPSKPEVP
ncbi:hypothetical protein CYMTET_32355 [Cymbomonas tetramitiformis]|uniref:Uncharacterized protein n=1 Tax=Cymbomonas tetramitiformis TaxID=36881 RepID=A0AAE0FFX6_9CHLO|nr:hypothetical protein CYMTET_32355 [Cymbomonas tetramitiformis]